MARRSHALVICHSFTTTAAAAVPPAIIGAVKGAETALQLTASHFLAIAMGVILLLGPVDAAEVAAQARPMHASASAERTAQSDMLLSSYASSDGPGLVLGIWQRGAVVYRGARGMADLEQSRPLTFTTPFHLASLSKEFTGLEILTLAAAGKLDTSADVHRYLPVLPDYSTPLRVEHLLHMISGLKDQWTLMMLSGRNWNDVLTQDELFAAVCRFKDLDFAPGAAYAYSNTNYMLLAEIAARVTKEPFAQIVKRDIFEPLGMHASFVYDDVSQLVPGRANSYWKDDSGHWHRTLLAYHNYGATSAHSTLDDMLRWGMALSSQKLNDLPLYRVLTQKTALANGEPVLYGAGLYGSRMFGREVVEHGGADASFKTEIVYFPADDLGIVVLANWELDPLDVARAAARIWLPVDRVEESKAVGAEPLQIAGIYAGGRTDGAVELKVNGDGLRLHTIDDSGLPLVPRGPDVLAVEGVDTTLQVIRDSNGQVVGLEEHNSTNPAAPYTVRRRRLHPPDYSADELAGFAGDYRSAALDVTYRVSVEQGALVLSNVFGSKRFVMQPADPDRFEIWDYAFRTLKFSREDGRIAAFIITTDRATNIRFDRVAAAPARVAGRG